MSGEKNLQVLLQHMEPVKQQGSYVFVSIPNPHEIRIDDVAMIFRESEGVTLILEQQRAIQMGFADGQLMAWITLNVHSSLDAIGLTAAFSSVLTKNGISCNVVAGFYHDHIFVPLSQAGLALDVLRSLSAKYNNKL
jgi:hypothetical protein